MPTVHFLNVGEGDCTIIQHGSGRVTMIDICNGQPMAATKRAERYALSSNAVLEAIRGDYGMRRTPTNPIAYLRGLRISSVFRFVLSHPDMDHMDGFDALCDEFAIWNFWDSGVRREKPDFSGGCYKEEDWDRYIDFVDGRQQGVTVLSKSAGATFKFANCGGGRNGGDYLDIVAPGPALVREANKSGDPNDASYVLVYRTCGGKIVFPGDAHDGTWEYVLENYQDSVADCAVLIAPHHGRKSDRCWDFLDVLNPSLSLFGYAKSEHLGYSAWNDRDLPFITNNQAGNVVLEATSTGIEVYVENQNYAAQWETCDSEKERYGCFFIGLVPKPQ